MNGLDLFSGIGGIAEALSPWVETVAYCENDSYATAVLLSRMSRGEIHTAPIWDDVTTLRGKDLPEIDIISGGFPCQDISIAGRGEGLEGKRSGLFGEIIRLAGEIRPQFLFLENVPAITFRGLSAVAGEISRLRYDCRWGLLSAYDVGAPHKRERWWLLGRDTKSNRSSKVREVPEGKVANPGRSGGDVPHTNQRGLPPKRPEQQATRSAGSDTQGADVADPDEPRPQGRKRKGVSECAGQRIVGEGNPRAGERYPWATEPGVGRVVNGLPFRSNRLMCLGNSVVPQCAREAFERLVGLKEI